MILAKKVAIAATAAVAITVTSVGVATAVNSDKARVVRVIDGDTLVVDFKNEELTVRLLNVDTPETKDPNEPVECLGPEATDFLKEALPQGSKVTLAFDVELEDRYGRTLAAVYDAQDRLINAEVARQGFGIPVTYGKNSKFRPPVDAAYQEAEEQKNGLFDDDVECTVAALESAAQEAAAQGTGTSAASAAAAAAAVFAAAKVVNEGFDALEAGAKAGNSLIWKVLSEADRSALLARAATAKGTIAERHGELTSLQEERQAAEDEAKRLEAEAKAEAERVAAEEEARKVAEAAQAEADRIAAAKAEAEAEAERIAAAQAEANRRAQQQQYVAPPQQQYAPPAQGNPSGYTGPRCYAPGGKTWRPC
ncbi:micrococcal nuclease [Arthrobacter sp. UYP6]|uniref:thermonuclease family protein n=1 Tax=Arthrobacter sp. UYP6 TaxID=1756378 RepID=UPI00339ADAD6